jgi:hypothetical protein
MCFLQCLEPRLDRGEPRIRAFREAVHVDRRFQHPLHRFGFTRCERLKRREVSKFAGHVRPLQIFAVRRLRVPLNAVADEHRPMVEAGNHAAFRLSADIAVAGVEDRPPDVGFRRLDHFCAMIDAASHATVASTANVNKQATTTREVWVIAVAP